MGDPIQTLSVGRIVHYVGENDGVHLAAIIAAVNEAQDSDSQDTVNITIYGPNGGQGFRMNVEYSDGAGSPSCPKGTWHWPERV